MKTIGMVRKVDSLGRIVFPIEIRKTLGIEEGEALEISLDEETIIIQKLKGKQCKKCEAQTYQNDKFCRKCGKKL